MTPPPPSPPKCISVILGSIICKVRYVGVKLMTKIMMVFQLGLHHLLPDCAAGGDHRQRILLRHHQEEPAFTQVNSFLPSVLYHIQ